MESSIAVFLKRRTACELPPTSHALSCACASKLGNTLGLRDRTSPICTLSQNGYGDYLERPRHCLLTLPRTGAVA